MFSSDLVVPLHEITCEAPAQSFRYNEPISTPPYVTEPRTPLFSVTTLPKANLPAESSQNIDAFLAEPS